MDCFLQRIASVWRPHPGQREFLLNKAKTKVLACGRRWGKTEACAVQVLGALAESDAPRRCYLVAPTLDQARILFDRILDLATRIRESCAGLFDRLLKATYAPYPRLRIDDNLIVARSGHRPRSLRGFEATDIVVDEAAYVPDVLVHDVLWPMMATTDGCMTLIGTPNGRNEFWRLYERGQSGDARFWSRRSPSAENDRVSSSFLDVQRSLLSDSSYAVEYEAAFLDRKGAVFPLVCVERCLVASFETEPRPPFFAGIDFARVQDYTAIAILSGDCDAARLVHLSRFQAETWTETVDWLVGIIRAFPGVRIVADETGCGSGPIEMLRPLIPGHPVEAFAFSARSKADLIGRLRRLIERAAIKMLPDEVLLREMEAYVEVPSAAGPSKLGAVSGHDDMVTALALAAWNLPRSHGPSIISGAQRPFFAS